MLRTCPKCGFERNEFDGLPPHECPRCGLIYDRYQAVEENPVPQENEQPPTAAAADPRINFQKETSNSGIRLAGLFLIIAALGGIAYVFFAKPDTAARTAAIPAETAVETEEHPKAVDSTPASDFPEAGEIKDVGKPGINHRYLLTGGASEILPFCVQLSDLAAGTDALTPGSYTFRTEKNDLEPLGIMLEVVDSEMNPIENALHFQVQITLPLEFKLPGGTIFPVSFVNRTDDPDTGTLRLKLRLEHWGGANSLIIDGPDCRPDANG